MSDCCSNDRTNARVTAGAPPHVAGTDSLHVVIVGGGSAAFAAALKANDIDVGVTLINDGLPLGGTCVNLGCVPSKALIRAAAAHYHAAHHPFRGIDSTSRIRSFEAVVAQKDHLVRQLRQEKYLDLLRAREGVRVIEGRASFMDAKTIQVNGEIVHAGRIIVATGASPFIPSIPGLGHVRYLTSTTAMALTELPDSLIVLGGRYIALELGQMFQRLGTDVTLVQRSPRILPDESQDLTDAVTRYLTEEGMQIVTGANVESVERTSHGAKVRVRVGGVQRELSGQHILVATGRRANTVGLDLAKGGVQSRADGSVMVDEYLRTSAPNVYAAGDVIGEHLYVYTAAYEGAIAAENAIMGDRQRRDYTALPWTIFTDPQIAGVGLDEEQARAAGFDAEAAVLPLEYVPRALVARDTRGFVKLVRDRQTDRLLGARIVAPEGGELVMEASLAIRHGIPVATLAQAFHPYLTLSEAIKLAAISFHRDVRKLSCCAT